MEEEPAPQEPARPEAPSPSEAIENLPQQLGFIETPELRALRPAVVEAMSSGDQDAIKQRLTEYQVLAEQLVEQQQGIDSAKTQIGLVVANGLMWRQAGKLNSYGNELWNAITYAEYAKLDKTAAALKAAYAEVESTVDESEVAEYTGPVTDEVIGTCKKELPEETHDDLDALEGTPDDEILEEVAAVMLNYDLEEPYEFFARMGWVYVQPTDDPLRENT